MDEECWAIQSDAFGSVLFVAWAHLPKND